ncbi:hypothetical protein [Psychromicrobium xiongbiense]|uniref:hypothetical protein n=1 Tax=Psychromicrobium xiongbiense TaxID=3051184 RepID=UPI0025559020|nr:hypothetical protein [Psychromicrobium sp. YIM S02556]
MTLNVNSDVSQTGSQKSGSKPLGIILLVIGLFCLVTSFDLVNRNQDLHTPGPGLLPTTSLMMSAWRPAFGIFLALAIFALIAGWITLRGLPRMTLIFTLPALLAIPGMLIPSADAGRIAVLILGIILPAAVIGVIELSRSLACSHSPARRFPR